jgi:glucose dehydrogenase
MTYPRILLSMTLALPLAFAQSGSGRSGGTRSEWPMFGRDPGAARFSPLNQINTRTIARLQRAWTFHTGKPGSEGIPIVAGGVMYLAAANGLFAIGPETGKQIWHYPATQVALRGLAYWPGDRTTHPRVFAGVRGGMIAVDAVTGKAATGSPANRRPASPTKACSI